MRRLVPSGSCNDFHPVIFTEAYGQGFGKPHPRAFEAVAEGLEANTDRARLRG